ncbi:cytochrome b-c1 complex subunit 2, mitochondrial [Folsomia candida]|uniref:Cytochrome b-c1 complex subunit 2, mitochondrial n=1 Tax=Folsomia candida TaxID=158441 RepID=A0A226EFY0_FOLCA|nr:cytochrome b-c1 complex subunit 2, mitochondrial [Folsomia candida]OXA56309.1 Cytochrome b-c1 complex subunit 2, mitochondrial [Folsomia candida]
MMALQPSVNPYLRKLAANNVRTFAAAAAAAKSPSPSSGSPQNSYHIPREPLKVSKVNNITVASVETNKPLAKLAVYIRAGSRFETDETQGVTQMLRICTGLGTQHSSQFNAIRTLEANGANLTCTTGREYVAYTVEASRTKMDDIQKFVKEYGFYQVFKPWEVSDNIPRLRLERKIRPPEARIMELIHKSAYRKGLGYSLYSPKWMIGNHSSEMLNNFVKSNYLEASIVATGMNHEELKLYAGALKMSEKPRNVPATKFYGGSELRKETRSGLAYVALAIEGASFTNQKNFITAALVHRALGSGPRTKRGLNSGGKLSAATSGDGVSLKASSSAFSSNYSDSGILGVFITATPCTVEAVTKKSAEILLSGGFSDADLARAKAQLKTDIACATDSDGGFLEEIGLQTLLTGAVTSPTEIEGLIDSVTASDMNTLVTKGKLSMASFGKIANVPHIDNLKK